MHFYMFRAVWAVSAAALSCLCYWLWLPLCLPLAVSRAVSAAVSSAPSGCRWLSLLQVFGFCCWSLLLLSLPFLLYPAAVFGCLCYCFCGCRWLSVALSLLMSLRLVSACASGRLSCCLRPPLAVSRAVSGAVSGCLCPCLWSFLCLRCCLCPAGQ